MFFTPLRHDLPDTPEQLQDIFLFRTLHGRTVTLFPDLGAFEKWQSIAAGIPNVTISNILERRATVADRAAGLDLADYLLREHKPAVTA
ncbi:MAG: hypothetical protein WCK32_08830 [Chlorobiaceae bacterium]